MFDMPFVIFDQSLCAQIFYFTFLGCPVHDLCFFRLSKGFGMFVIPFLCQGKCRNYILKKIFPSIDFKLFELFCLFPVNVFFVSLES